jgi:single-stranded DNA-binding protein
MTAYALITGTIFRPAQSKMSKAGRPYASCTIKAATDGNESDFWNAICFSETATAELLRLEAGDACAVRGKMRLEIFEKNGQARISRTIFADAAIGLRPAPRKAKAATAPAAQEQPATTDPAGAPPFDDGIPF